MRAALMVGFEVEGEQQTLASVDVVRQRLVRSDAMPEFTHYRDEGCELSPSCLDCPLARCRYDGNGINKIRRMRHALEVRRLREEGLTVNEIVERTGLSRRTIFGLSGRGQR